MQYKPRKTYLFMEQITLYPTKIVGRKHQAKQNKVHTLLPDMTRTEVAKLLGYSTVRSVQTLLLTGATFLDPLKIYVDPDTGALNGRPLENEQHLELLRTIQELINRYRRTKNKAQIIQEKLQNLNEKIARGEYDYN
jgi:hypothetical protein